MIGSEDRADGRGDDVEARVVVGERLGVADLEGDVDAALGSLPPRRLDQRGGEVAPRDVGAGPDGHERELARAAAHVEPALALRSVDRADDRLVHLGERLGDSLEGRRAPHRRVPLLQLLESHRASLVSRGRGHNRRPALDDAAPARVSLAALG